MVLQKMKTMSRITYVPILVMMVSLVIATKIELVEVEGDTLRNLEFDLNEGETFKGSLVMISGEWIDFEVYDPHSRTIVTLGIISQESSFTFTAKISGIYTFRFENRYSSESKLVELSYDIHLPPSIELDFGTILMIAFLLAMTIVIVLWWRFR